MGAIQRTILPEKDGELVIRDLPVRRNQRVNVIVLTDEISGESAQTLALLNCDPSWAWLRDPAENIYSEDDVKDRG